MKHVRKFDNELKYKSFCGGVNYITPIISLCKDNKKMQYKRKEHLYVNDYLTIEAIEQCTVQFKPSTKDETDESEYEINTISYSVDDGQTWQTQTTLGNDGYYVLGTLQPGEHMLLKGNCLPYFNYNRDGNKFDGIGRIEGDGKYNVSGNIMSLLFGDNFKGQENISDYKYSGVFSKLFWTEINLMNIENLILPATKLSNYCYADMFNTCESIIKPCKILPAMILSEGCYCDMFCDCKLLIETPELPATILGEWCYCEMFYGCISLIKTCDLPAPILVSGCYDCMFENCESLIVAPEIFATSMKKGSECCCDWMFCCCTELTTPPSVLRSINVTTESYYAMFDECTSLETAPQILAKSIEDEGCRLMFENCESLLFAPELPATILGEDCYMQMFYGCTDLVTVPSILPATTLAQSCYYGMFMNCESLTTVPVNMLPSTTLEHECYDQMFSGCDSLTIAPDLPATTLTNHCYYGMFSCCSSLTTAPELPATILEVSCYEYMFNSCTSLTSITCLATDISAKDCTSSWVNNVASSGTFIKNPSMTSWAISISGIPSGWTIQNAS